VNCTNSDCVVSTVTKKSLEDSVRSKPGLLRIEVLQLDIGSSNSHKTDNVLEEMGEDVLLSAFIVRIYLQKIYTYLGRLRTRQEIRKRREYPILVQRRRKNGQMALKTGHGDGK
jgi:hypothetical protein